MCGKGSNTTTQTTAPPPQVSAAYNSLMERATDVSNTPYQAYTGQRVADLTPDQMQAMSSITGMGNLAQPYLNEGADYMRQSTEAVTPTALQPYMNPYQQSVIDATLARTAQADAQAQNQVTGNAALRGALGGDRMGIAQAELAGQQKLARDQTVAGLNQQNYTQALAAWQADQARKAQAGYGISSLGTVAQNAELSRLQAALGVGNQQQQQNQANLNVPYQNYLEQRAYPFQTSQWLASILGATTPALGSTTTTQGPKPNTWNQALGGLTALGSFLLSTGGRVGYADGGAITPFNPTAVPMTLGVGYVPASQIRAGQGLRPVPSAQQPQQDDSMSRMTNNFVAAMKAMRGEPDATGNADGLSDYQATNSDGAHAHGGRVGYESGGAIDWNLYGDPSATTISHYTSPQYDPTTVPSDRFYNPDLAPLDSNWNPVYTEPRQQPVVRSMQPTQASPTQPEWETSTRLPPTQPEKSRGFLAGLKDYLPQRAGLIPESMRLPLLTAGLGMMKSNSPYLGQAIGEGGLMGVQAYMTQEQQARANELKKRQIELQSQRLADAAERARQTLDFNREKQGDLNDYRRDSLEARKSTSKQGAVERLAERVATELNIPFSQALERVRASNKDPQTMLSLERLALQAAKNDAISYQTDPKATLSKWRKDYGLPEKPMVLKGFDTPNPNAPAPTAPVTYPGGRTKEQLIKDTQAWVKANPNEKDAKKEDLKRYGIDPSVLDQ